MVRWLLSAATLVALTAPGYALTEQDIVEGLGDDLAEAVAPLHRVVPAQQLSLTASLDLAGDRAQLDMDLALRALAADLAIASGNLSLAGRDTAFVARQQYINDVSQAVTKYQQAVATSYNGWTAGAAQAYQNSQQNGSQNLQTAFQGLTAAHQRAMQAMAGSDWGEAPPVARPTLPYLAGGVNEDAERLAEAAFVISEARQSYLADVNALLAACDERLEAATTGDRDAMAVAMTEALRNLNETSCRRYLQYDADVRHVLAALCDTCGTP